MKSWFVKQMAMYKSYHKDGRNQAMHHIGVPIIVFSILVLLSYTPITLVVGFHITAATLLLSLLFLFYAFSSLMLGCITAGFYIPFLWVADYVVRINPSAGWTIFLITFFGGLVTQFIGHIFERRRPAFMDNAMLVVIAPGFLIAEILFYLGLEREFKASIDAEGGEKLSTELTQE